MAQIMISPCTTTTTSTGGAHMKAKQLRGTPGVDTAISLPPAPSVTPLVRVSSHRPAAPVEVEERAHHTVALHDLCSDTTIPLPRAPASSPVHEHASPRCTCLILATCTSHCRAARPMQCNKCDQGTHLGCRPCDGWEGVQKGEGVDLGHRLRFPGEAIHGHYTGTHGHLDKATGTHSKQVSGHTHKS